MRMGVLQPHRTMWFLLLGAALLLVLLLPEAAAAQSGNNTGSNNATHTNAKTSGGNSTTHFPSQQPQPIHQNSGNNSAAQGQANSTGSHPYVPGGTVNGGASSNSQNWMRLQPRQNSSAQNATSQGTVIRGGNVNPQANVMLRRNGGIQPGTNATTYSGGFGRPASPWLNNQTLNVQRNNNPALTGQRTFGPATPGSPLSAAQSSTALRQLNMSRAAMRGINSTPIPMGQVASLPNGNFMIHAGGRQYGVRPSGRLAFFSGNGQMATFRSNGGLNFVHTPTMDIMHGGRGQRTIVMRRPDQSLLVSTGANTGYLEKSLVFHGHTFIRRTYVIGGQTFQRTFIPFSFHGVLLDSFVLAHHCNPVVYAWAGQGWGQPVWYTWPWRHDAWYAYYGPYYTPQSSYSSPSDWLADYYLSQTMSDGYTSQPDTSDQTTENVTGTTGTPSIYDPNAAYPGTRELMKIPKRHDATANSDSGSGSEENAAPDGSGSNSEQPGNPQASPDDDPTAQETTPISIELKKQIVEQVQQELEYEKAAVATPDSSQPGADLPDVLQPGHVFIVNAALSATTADQRSCALSVGDALQLASAPADGAATADLTVASGLKGDCPVGTQVALPLESLQEMQNNFRQRIDSGLQALQGPTGLPPAPKAADIPAGDIPPATAAAGNSDVETLLQSEQQEADHAESKVSQAAFASGGE